MPVLVHARGEDYAHQQPSLTAKKLRLLQIRAGAPTLKGTSTGVWATRQAMREGERRLAEQADVCASTRHRLAPTRSLTPSRLLDNTPADSGEDPARPKSGSIHAA
jgi:hypothetical protein